MSNRAPDWLRQAEADLKHAQSAVEDDAFEWSCFAAQQGAEKAVKAGAKPAMHAVMVHVRIQPERYEHIPIQRQVMSRHPRFPRAAQYLL